jgi:LuxR family maltose regulon positive regulatory protein
MVSPQVGLLGGNTGQAGKMVEPRSGAQAVVAAEQDALLATKLHVPQSRPDLIPRPRLAERLDEGLAHRLTLLCATAGYGKTVLLADWVRRGRHRVAWLSLDAGDNDPARFWRHGLAALDQVRPGLAEQVRPLLGPPAPASYELLVTALINELAAEPEAGRALLVLDDYHLIDSSAVHTSLGFLLEHQPPGLSLVLTSRTDPPLALARLRGRGQLAELRAADLRFTVDEAVALLQQGVAVSGAVLPEAAVAALVTRTEGWAAGLQLAALSLHGQVDAAGFMAAFTGSHRYVLDYLTEEVLLQQTEQVRTFLLETSVLGRLSGDLCDAVTGRTGSQSLLERVERAGLFLVPLDEVRGWWRYHHLFADLLRARLQQEQPDRAVLLHHNAALWCQEHGLPEDAIGHAVDAGEMTWAARLIEQYADALIYLRGEGPTVQRWLARLPAALIASRPRLLLAQAALADASGHVEEGEIMLDAAERASAQAAGEPFEPTVGRATSMLVNVPAAIALDRGYLAELRGDASATAAFAAQALAELSEDEWMLKSIATGLLASADWLRGRLAEAEGGFAPSMEGWQAAGQFTMIAWGCHHLGQVQRGQGRLDAAARTCQQALERSAVSGRAPLAVAGPAYVGLAEVAYQRNELGTALDQVTEGVALCRQFVYTAPLASGLATLAWIRQASGDSAGALEAIGEAMLAAPVPPGLVNPIPAQRARLLLAQGDLAAAAGWAQDRGLTADDEPDYAREPGHLLLARVLLAQGRPGPALALLDRLHAAAVTQERTGSLVEIGALRALALAAGGQETAAMTVLSEALTLASPQGYVRLFADEGPPMARVLAWLIAARPEGQAAAGVPPGYLAQLQHACDAEPTGPSRPSGQAPATAPGLAEQLTRRELEILEMLATGMSNQAIADQLFVALDTVKKHVSHVLSKLGAANRTAAVTRARELGLIP